MIRAIILLLFITQSALAAEISIKFHEDAGVKLAGNRFVIDSLNARAASSSSSQSDVDAINNTLQRLQRNSARENSTTRTQALVVAPFGGYSARFLSEWRRTAEEFWGEPLEDLSQFYSISVDENDHSAIESFFALKSLGVVEEIEFISVPVLTSASATPSFESKQGYLENNDNGIYAHHAWTLDGGRGNGTKVVAIEGAWNADHEDFPDLFYSSVIGASGESSVQHGTQSMGVVGAKDNGFGMTGIVSSASFGVETYGNLNYNGPNSNNLPSDYITNAAIAVGVGGVVFIEFGRLNPVADIYTPDCTCGLSQCGQMAIEISSPAFNAIKQAVGNGVIVVEPAGNGTADMDHSVYEGKFDRNIRDSGAIMVGASIPTDRTPLCFTNYGSRIDVHACV